MATLGNTFVDLIDIYKQTDPDGSAARIIEILKQQNPVLEDAIAMECNDGGKHEHTIRTGLPSVAWGKLYKGIPQSKSHTQQVVDTTGFVNALSTIDSRVLKKAKGNEAQIRLNEALAFIESMNQEAATGIFYHSTDTTPEKIQGLSPRYSVRGGSGAGNNVIHGGGSGSDNTSIWFVTWGDRFTHLLYPEGSKAGLQREDKGEQRVTDANDDAYYVMEELFQWDLGVAVKDWRYNSRVANIDVSEMQAGNVALYDLMRQAYYKLQSRMRRGDAATGRQAIYCNRDVLEALDALATNAGASDSFVRLKPMEIQGEEVLTYRGIPIRETDALVNNEELVPTA
ncbi:MAG: hypothetical protein RIG26_14970 [Thalassospira sp.]|uniref:major capsid protein n=1 Tax=Thalassospira sp. TaxID=1912094 RepID=UPI0032ED1980